MDKSVKFLLIPLLVFGLVVNNSSKFTSLLQKINWEALLDKDTKPDPDPQPEPSPAANTLTDEVRAVVTQADLNTTQRQVAYGKYKAFSEWILSTPKISTTADAAEVFTSIEYGIVVPGLAEITQRYLIEYKLDTVQDLTPDVREQQSRYYLDIAKGFL